MEVFSLERESNESSMDMLDFACKISMLEKETPKADEYADKWGQRNKYKRTFYSMVLV